jgi:hypothetical protein
LAALKKDDIDLIVRARPHFLEFGFDHFTQVSEFEVPRSKAEKALAENNGDIAKTLNALIGL